MTLYYILQLKNNALSANKSDDQNQNESQYNRSNFIQIFKVRRYVREAKYFMQSETEKQHVSLDGKTKMSEDLVDYSLHAINNINSYVKARVSNTDIEIKPIYVTEEEKVQANSISNMTVKEIKVKIFQVLELLGNETSKVLEEDYRKNVRNKKKEAYVEFYYKLLEHLDDESIPAETETETESLEDC